MDQNPSWKSDHDLFQQKTLPLLKKYGQRIGEMHSEGNEISTEVIRLYQMLYSRFDPMVHHLLQVELQKWISVCNSPVAS